MQEIYFILFKTKLINHITTVLIVKTIQSSRHHFKNTYRAFSIYSFVPLTGGTTAGMHILRLPTYYAKHFSKVFIHMHFPRGTVISLQCLMYMYFYSFCKNAIFTTKFKGLFVYIFYTNLSNLIFINFYVRRMRR